MKILRPYPARRSEDALATMIFIVLLSIMMVLVTAESRTLYLLHRNVKLLEQQQMNRLNGPPAGAIATTASGTK